MTHRPPQPVPVRIALAMGGGGARGAYQAGVLRYLARELDPRGFQLITGVSAGAINAVHLANHRGSLLESADELVELWRSIEVEKVFKTTPTAMLGGVVRWGLRLLSAGHGFAPRARGLVDTSPLREFLCGALRTEGEPLEGIRHNIAAGRLRAVAVTAVNYGTGRSTTWVDGASDCALWERPHRRAVATRLTVDHVMASTALPLFFPSVQVEGGWYGDGSVRHMAPLAPAIHLGADRILAISTRYARNVDEAAQSSITGYPPPAQILGVLMNSILLDVLDYDVQQVLRFNELLEQLPSCAPSGGLRVARVYTIRPSRDLGKLASEYEMKLPRAFRYLERGLGSRETRSPDLLSYLMFQRDFIERLVALGEQDAAACAPELRAFLRGAPLELSTASRGAGTG